jgi:transcription antitermination factor NusG
VGVSAFRLIFAFRKTLQDLMNVSDRGEAMPEIQPGREDQQRWFAVYTRHHHERTVAFALITKGFEVFLPQYNAIQRWKDRKKIVPFPLFPCYLFAYFSLNRKVEILRTQGVHWIVESSGHAVPIPEEEIHSIRQLCASGKAQPFAYLRVGDRIRIRRGPLAGAEGFLVRSKNSYRVVVSIHLLQKSVAVEIDAMDLEGSGAIGSRSSDYSLMRTKVAATHV